MQVHLRLSTIKGVARTRIAAARTEQPLRAKMRAYGTAEHTSEIKSANQSAPRVGPLQSRERLRAHAAVYRFLVRGVSFDGRQSAVNTLQTDEAIMMVPEPENEYDQNAIAIKKLNGDQLGYVPRERNQDRAFNGGVRFGNIKSVGPALSAQEILLGAQVEFQPQLSPLHTLPAAGAMREVLTSLHGQVSEKDWADLGNRTIRAANGRCHISGAVCDDLVACPSWREDTKQRKYILKGIACMSAQLLEARNTLLDEPPSPQGLWTVQSVNGWISSEVQAYIGYLKALRRQRDQESWQVDVSWLEQKGHRKLSGVTDSLRNLSI